MSLPITEDTPPDMLAGSMDLKVVLPDGQSVKMSVERGTPMMDLLVQVTTAHCLSPGDHSLQAIGDRGVLPFKPSTPIGALDTFAVKIVEKKLHPRGRAPKVPQSFLNTFRLQVHLPRSQLFVLRVTPDVTLSEIMTHICTEKNLNMGKYEFRNPGNLDEVLELDKTLGDYKLQELSMMSKGNRTVTGLMSSADIINVKSSKQRQNSVCDSSLSSGSFGSRSGSPIPPITVVTMPPQPPMRKKRRPAPKPPTFAQNEKKDQNTGSVLISHSRESSDSSGYHEASVLSESPTHGSRMDSDSPPDTLPRRSKLPPSQSFTNLTSIQPPPKNRLISSVSNTSLNSNGLSRKKRAPPPPPTLTLHENKVKSSTLPTSVTEERRNGSTFVTGTSFVRLQPDSPVELSATPKVQSPVQPEPDSILETKASNDEVPACLDVDVRVPPKPKPRTSIPKTPPKRSSPGDVDHWRNLGNLAEEETKSSGKWESQTESGLLGESSEPSREGAAQDHADRDSINWEYQLPPPPTDFRDSSSPTCTEFGTITITPDVLENVADPREKNSDDRQCELTQVKAQDASNKSLSDKRFSQNKSIVMNELTNILNERQKFKEKSLSVTNLYITDSGAKEDCRKIGLNYSSSFSTEPTSCLHNFNLTRGLGNNRKLSSSNEVICNNNSRDITYRNYKNLEKSYSMECIQQRTPEGCKLIEKTEDVFRKPVAPVQKKLKVAKRSASSVGIADPSAIHRRNSPEGDSNWEEDENINILREQFLQFLKEKKLSSDLNMKSLDVIRNILPELEKDGRGNGRVLVISQSNERNSQDADRVDVNTNTADPPPKKEATPKKETVTKRYSYQGPPSINFSTWGERPKTTKIIIKDEDYVTREKVTEKSAGRAGEVPAPKPKEVIKKPPQVVIKKPGVLSRYEMFSALPRRKDPSSLEMVHMEDEEKKRRGEGKEFNRLPVVCGVEVKKESRDPPAQQKHSVSVYVNGTREIERDASVPQKRHPALMPVVKGFRILDEGVGTRGKKEKASGVVPLPPPPPPLPGGVSLVKLKGASSVMRRQGSVPEDPRSQLLKEIRNFGGWHKLRRTVADD